MNKPYSGENTAKAIIKNIKASFASKTHKHPVSDITDIQTELRNIANEAAGYTDTKISTEAAAREIGDINTLQSAQSYTNEKITETTIDLSNTISTNYNESIIGLSVDGQTVTYIKGDGSVHSFDTQDTNTTYSLATDETTGLTKLYATTGSAEDGTMTQKAIKTELDKKVGVTVDDSRDTLIFTI